jgi:hypothetical protein
METKLTKGEWTIINHSEEKLWFNIGSEKGVLVRTFYGALEPIVTQEEALANAKLIAAAPAILDVLIEYVNESKQYIPVNSNCAFIQLKAEKIIKKATE